MTASAQHHYREKDSTEEAQAAAAASLVADGYTRLHISPLDDDLLQIILPSALRPKAQGISFHALQTFPEKRYGFVELPLADADKIRKKLNGAILRGTKLRIEPARPDDYMAPSPDDHHPSEDENTKKEKSKKHKREKKRKRDHGEIPGVELEDGRKVKRGWTVSAAEAQSNRRDRDKSKDKDKDKDKKKKDKKEKKRNREIKSKYSDGPECLVKTRLPPNKADLAGPEAEDGESRKKRKKSKSREVVVHEFEKTTKFPSFLKQTQAATDATASTEYVEGKGWVDADGNVVQPVKSTRPAVSSEARPSKKKQTHVQDEDDETSSSGSSSSSEDGEDGEDAEGEAPATENMDVDAEQGVVSSPRRAEVDLAINTDITSPQSAPNSARPKSSGSARSLTIKIPPATPATQKVHPLEALYKRSKPDENASTPAVTSEVKPFSFFDSEDVEEETPAATRASQMPMTPFTQQEFEWRNIRSAAPTPDTAHPNKTFKLWPTDEDVEEEEAEEEDGVDTRHQVADPAEDEEGSERLQGDEDDDDEDKVSANPSTDFQKWFWEHRGDLNRSWKKRRKTAAKEKRYRENRARADRAI